MPRSTSTKKEKQQYTAILTGKSSRIELYRLELEPLLLLLQALEPCVSQMGPSLDIDIRPRQMEISYDEVKIGNRGSLSSSTKASTTTSGPFGSLSGE